MAGIVEANFTSTSDVTNGFDVEGTFSVSISGTYTGTIVLERSILYSELSTDYRVVKEYDGEEVEELADDVGSGILYRLRATSSFSGDVNVALIK